MACDITVNVNGKKYSAQSIEELSKLIENDLDAIRAEIDKAIPKAQPPGKTNTQSKTETKAEQPKVKYYTGSLPTIAPIVLKSESSKRVETLKARVQALDASIKDLQSKQSSAPQANVRTHKDTIAEYNAMKQKMAGDNSQPKEGESFYLYSPQSNGTFIKPPDNVDMNDVMYIGKIENGQVKIMLIPEKRVMTRGIALAPSLLMPANNISMNQYGSEMFEDVVITPARYTVLFDTKGNMVGFGRSEHGAIDLESTLRRGVRAAAPDPKLEVMVKEKASLEKEIASTKIDKDVEYSLTSLSGLKANQNAIDSVRFEKLLNSMKSLQSEFEKLRAAVNKGDDALVKKLQKSVSDADVSLNSEIVQAKSDFIKEQNKASKPVSNAANIAPPTSTQPSVVPSTVSVREFTNTSFTTTNDSVTRMARIIRSSMDKFYEELRKNLAAGKVLIVTDSQQFVAKASADNLAEFLTAIEGIKNLQIEFISDYGSNTFAPSERVTQLQKELEPDTDEAPFSLDPLDNNTISSMSFDEEVIVDGRFADALNYVVKELEFGELDVDGKATLLRVKQAFLNKPLNTMQPLLDAIDKALADDSPTAVQDILNTPEYKNLLTMASLLNAEQQLSTNQEKIQSRLISNFKFPVPIGGIDMALDVNNMRALVDGMNFFVFSKFRTMKSTDLLKAGISDIYEEVRENMEKTLSSRVKDLGLGDNAVETIALKYLFGTSPSARRNYMELVKFHSYRLSQYKISVNEDVFAIEESESVKDSIHDSVAFEFDTKDMMPPEVKLFIASAATTVHQMYNGEMFSSTRTGNLGMPTLSNFTHVFNFVSKHLTGVSNTSTAMRNKLNKVRETEQLKAGTKAEFASKSPNPVITDPYSEIVNALHDAFAYPDPNDVGNMSDEDLMTSVLFVNKLVTTFSKNAPDFFITDFKDGSLSTSEQNTASLRNKLVGGYIENYKSKVLTLQDGRYGASKQKLTDLAKDLLALQQPAKEVSSGKPRPEAVAKLHRDINNAITALGIEVDDVVSLIDNMELLSRQNSNAVAGSVGGRYDRIIDFTNTLAKFINEFVASDTVDKSLDGSVIYDNPVQVFFSKYMGSAMQTVNKDLYNKLSNEFMDAEVISTNKVISNQTQNANGKSVYGVTMNHQLSNLTTDINEAVDEIRGLGNNLDAKNELLRKKVPMLATGFAANSLVKQKILNASIKMTVGYMNGMQSTSSSDVFKDLTPAERFAAQIHNTMRGSMYLQRAADRTIETVFQLTLPGGKPVTLIDSTNVKKAMTETYKAFQGYLADEMTMRILANAGHGSNHLNYNKNGKKARFMDAEKLGEMATAVEDFIKSIKAEEGTDVRDAVKRFISENSGKLNTQFKKYIGDAGSGRTGKLINFADELGLILDGKYVGFSTQFAENFEENMQIYAMLSEINYIEVCKSMLGDPAYRSDQDEFFKRVRPMNGTRKDSAVGEELDAILNATNRMTITYDVKGSPKTLVLDGNNAKDKQTILNFISGKDIYDSRTKLNKDTKGVKVSVGPGFRTDYLLSGRTHDSTIDTMCLADPRIDAEVMRGQDKKAMSSVIGIKVSGKPGSQSVEFNTKSGTVNPDAIAEFTKFLATEFYNDGITNPAKLASKVKAYTKAYTNMKEPDGESYLTIHMYRDVMMRNEGAWLNEHERAYVAMITGKPLNKRDAALFRKLKTIGTGVLDTYVDSLGTGDDARLVSPLIYKHSVMPIHPALVGKDTVLAKLHKFMEQHGVGMAVYTSANKVGMRFGADGKPMDLYDATGDFKTEGNKLNGKALFTQRSSYKHFGIQVDMKPVYKDKVTVGSQYRKLIISNMLSGGMPTDISINDRMKWDSLSEKERRKKSTLYSLTKDYIAAQDAMYDGALEQLVSELDMSVTVDANNNITSYRIGNMEKLTGILIEAGMGRDYTTNTLNSMLRLESGETFIEYLADSDKIENILFAVINSRIIKEKRAGTGAPQTAVTGWEVKKREVGFSNTGVLKFYRKGKNGKTLPAECMFRTPADKGFQSWMKANYKDLDGLNAALDELNVKLEAIEERGESITLTPEEEKLHDAVKMVGFRIPTQGMNSGDMLRIRRFLPINAADTIVVPSEIVGKSGSDFDIDKMSLYMKGFKYENDTINFAKFDTSTSADAVRKRYDAYLNSVKLTKEKSLALREEIDQEVNSSNLDGILDLRTGLESTKLQLDSITGELDSVSLEAKAARSVNTLSELSDTFAAISSQDSVEDLHQALVTLRAVANNIKDYSKNKDPEVKNVVNMVKKIQAELDESDSPKSLSKLLDNAETHVHNLLKENASINGFKSDFEDYSAARKELFAQKDAVNSNLDAIKSSLKTKYRDLMNKKKEELIKSGKIKGHTLESFSKLPIEKQHNKKQIENRLVDLHFDIMSEPSNYRQLMSPITTAILTDELVGKVWDIRFLTEHEGELGNKFKAFMRAKVGKTPEEARKLYDQYKAEYISEYQSYISAKSWSAVSDPIVNIMKGLHFLSGKAGVGMSAVHVTHHQLALLADLQFNSKPEDLNLYFDMNTKNGNISFGERLSVTGELISETLSALVNAYVDVAADPFIFDLNAGQETANMQFMMIRMGMNEDVVYKFMAQPVIKEYNRLKSKYSSKMLQEYNLANPDSRIIKKDEDLMLMAIEQTSNESSELNAIINLRGEARDGWFTENFGSKAIQGHNNTINNLIKAYKNKTPITVSNPDGSFASYVASDENTLRTVIKIIGLDGELGKLDTALNHKAVHSEEVLTDIIAKDSLAKMKNEYAPTDYKVQAAILDTYFTLQQMSAKLQRSIRASAADTKGVPKNRSVLSHWDAEHTVTKNLKEFKNLDKILEESVVRIPTHAVTVLGKTFDNLFIVESNPIIKTALNSLQGGITTLKNMYKERDVELLKKDVVSKFSQSLISSFIPGFKNSDVFNLLIDTIDYNGKKHSFPYILRESINSPTGIMDRTNNNILLESLEIVTSASKFRSYNQFQNKVFIDQNETGFDTVRFRFLNESRITLDDFTDALDALRTSPQNKKLYYQLLRTAVTQYGFANSKHTFTHLFPEQSVNYLKKTATEAFLAMSTLEQQQWLDNFTSQYMQASTRYQLTASDLYFTPGSYNADFGQSSASYKMSKTKLPMLSPSIGMLKKSGKLSYLEMSSTRIGKDGETVLTGTWGIGRLPVTALTTMAADSKQRESMIPIKGFPNLFNGIDVEVDPTSVSLRSNSLDVNEVMNKITEC